MIPKIIHYCWFGGNPLPVQAEKCIESWKKYCPDYEIIEWNESNFDINSYNYVREAYESKKWAFVSDVVRLHSIVNYGGIYMDTDVEVIKSLDSLLSHKAIIGFESARSLQTAFLACEKGQSFFASLLKKYTELHFITSDGSYDLMPNVDRIYEYCMTCGLKEDNSTQKVNDLTVFPKEYFSPKDVSTRLIHITPNTYVIHHFDGSWLTEEQRYYNLLIEKKLPSKLAKILSLLQHRGFLETAGELSKYVQKRKSKDEQNN